MKLILSLISVILFVQLINGYKYINYLPYKDNKCTVQGGFGYSSIVDTCVSFDNNAAMVWHYHESNGTVTYSSYFNTNLICGIGSYANVYNIAKGSCVEASWYSNFDQNRTIPGDQFFKIEITDTPIILSGSYVNSYGESCTGKNDIVTVEYFTSGTIVKNHMNSCNGDNFIYSCNSKNVPTVTSVNNQCPKFNSHGEKCVEFIPLRNQSDYSYSESSSQCGEDSGTGSSSCYYPSSATGSSGDAFNLKFNGGFGNNKPSSPQSSDNSVISGESTGGEFTGSSNSYDNSVSSDNSNSHSSVAPLIYISTYCS